MISSAKFLSIYVAYIFEGHRVSAFWPQFNLIIYHFCIRPSFPVLQALQDNENSTGSIKKLRAESGAGRSNTRLGWMRTR